MHDAHVDDPEFGYRLLADQARDAADRTAWRITPASGWWSVFGKKRGKSKRPGPAVHDDLCAVVNESGGAARVHR